MFDDRDREFDPAATLHRSLRDARSFIAATLPVTDSTSYPKRLLYPLDFPPQSDSEQQAMCEDFYTIVEDFLGVKRTPISIRDMWATKPPKEAGAKTLQDAVWPMYYDTYHTFDNFRKDYRAAFGKEAFVGPYMRKRWSLAVPFTEEKQTGGVAEMKIFRTWFDEHIMGKGPDGITIAFALMPFGSATPKYRDDPNKLPSIVPSFSVFYLPAILQLPQLPHESRVSGHTEYLPIVSTLMGASGSDPLLINLAQDVLQKAGWPTEVMMGREMFKVGKNIRNVL
ncbi:hypothetical protein CAC42_4463 [Sphaceloma murrayae]|uniref:Uncharacterized protein n=1 Tax=Sphaceloma murrayae TaxID=2082308 RepID=A0A2K1QM96_9PEZI|nr:hypothetical protein CAC42_4463 [Sphaceloma murrayae]